MNDDHNDLRFKIIQYYLQNEFSPDLEREVRQWLMDIGLPEIENDKASLEFWNELPHGDAADEDTKRIWGKIIRERNEKNAGYEEDTVEREGECRDCEENPGAR